MDPRVAIKTVLSPHTHVALPLGFRADLPSSGRETPVSPASVQSNISNTTGALSVRRGLFPTGLRPFSLPTLYTHFPLPSLLYIIRSLVASLLRSILRVMTFIDPPCALAATRRKSTEKVGGRAQGGGARKREAGEWGGVGGVLPRDLKHQRHHFYLFVSRAQRVGLFCLPPPALSAARFPPSAPSALAPPGTSLFRMHVFSSFGFSLSFYRSLSLSHSFLFSRSLGSRESQGLIDIQCRTAINSTLVQQQFQGTGRRD